MQQLRATALLGSPQPSFNLITSLILRMDNFSCAIPTSSCDLREAKNGGFGHPAPAKIPEHADHSFRSRTEKRSAWPGIRDRHAPESLIGMARNE